MARLRTFQKMTAAVMLKVIAPFVGRDGLADAVGYIENAGPPTTVVPDFVGQLLLDTTNFVFYRATTFNVAGAWIIVSGGVSAGNAAAFSDATAGNITYTAAQLLGGTIVRDPNGASRTDVLPTAALLVAAIPGAKVGQMVRTYIVNGADAAETITLTAGAGGTYDANQTAASRLVGQNASKTITIRLTNVTGGAEAYVVYL